MVTVTLWLGSESVVDPLKGGVESDVVAPLAGASSVMLGAATAVWTPTASVAATTTNCAARSRVILFRPLSARLFLRKPGQSVGVAAAPGNLEPARCGPLDVVHRRAGLARLALDHVLHRGLGEDVTRRGGGVAEHALGVGAERAVEQLDELEHRDLRRRAGERVAALDAALRAQHAGAAQDGEELLEELHGDVAAPGQLADRHRPVTAAPAELGEGLQRVRGLGGDGDHGIDLRCRSYATRTHCRLRAAAGADGPHLLPVRPARPELGAGAGRRDRPQARPHGGVRAAVVVVVPRVRFPATGPGRGHRARLRRDRRVPPDLRAWAGRIPD